MHISQQYFKSGDATVAQRSTPPRIHDWSKTPDPSRLLVHLALLQLPKSNAHAFKRAAARKVLDAPSIVWQGGEYVWGWGDQATRRVMAAGEVLYENKKQPM